MHHLLMETHIQDARQTLFFLALQIAIVPRNVSPAAMGLEGILGKIKEDTTLK